MVTTCCHDRRRVFCSVDRCTALIEEIRACDESGLTDTYAFVVMPDHLHWLFSLRTEFGLSNVVRRTKARTTLRIHRSGIQKQRIWQEGFHDHLIRTDEELASLGEYIVHNPVRAGLVEHPEQYPHWDVLWRRWRVRG